MSLAFVVAVAVSVLGVVVVAVVVVVVIVGVAVIKELLLIAATHHKTANVAIFNHELFMMSRFSRMVNAINRL